MNVQPFLIGEGWLEVLDGNDTARDIFKRHYSYRPRVAGRRINELIIGPGEKYLLLSADGGALCAWRKEKHRRDGQSGVECCIFRRESGDVASVMLLDSMNRAWRKWSSTRLFSFIDPKKVEPTMIKGPRGHLYPVWGYCFYQVGWRFAGLTGKGLHILECLPEFISPSDGDAISEVKGIARPENAAGVEPPPSGPHSLPDTPPQAADSPALSPTGASGPHSTQGAA